MELKFTKDAQSGNWVSEYEAKAGFNLHIEGAKKLRLYQRTAGSRYDEIEGEYKDGAYSFDYDFNALVYPKFIKIVSETEPTYAEVVSDGEITEIKSQTKEVEVTANGTTQVAPDAGFSYLTGVSIKTNVPQSGGSGGAEVLYLGAPVGGGISGNASAATSAAMVSVVNKVLTKSGEIVFAPFSMDDMGVYEPKEYLAYCLLADARCIIPSLGQDVTIKENITAMELRFGVTFPRLTEEQFYNLG